MIQILYVDDEPAILEIGKALLEAKHEFQVYTCTSPVEALSLLATRFYDVVISDYLMPDIDGIRFLHEVRSLHQKIPFIFFTGQATRSIVIEAINSGADFFLEKDQSPTTRFLDLAQLIRLAVRRYRTEVLLAESEKKYRQIIELSVEGVWLLDADAHTTFVNPRMGEMLGYSEEEMIGKSLASFMKDQGPDHSEYTVERLIQGSNEHLDLEFIRKDSTRIYTSVGTSPLTNEKGQCTGVLAMVADITERRSVEQAVRLANKKLHLLSDITRHDILNQIQALYFYVESANADIHEPAVQDLIKKIDIAVHNIQRQITFTRDYQDLGVKSPAWQDVRRTIDLAVRPLHLPPIEVQNEIYEIQVYADPLLGKVFYNLADNAKRYGGKITTLRFTAEDRDGSLVIVCEDDGVGVPEKVKRAIFNRQYYVNTGFGLNLSQEILSITDLSIRETGVEGVGARFEILVPKENFRTNLSDCGK